MCPDDAKKAHRDLYIQADLRQEGRPSFRTMNKVFFFFFFVKVHSNTGSDSEIPTVTLESEFDAGVKFVKVLTDGRAEASL